MAHFKDLTPGTVVYYIDSAKSWVNKRAEVAAIDAGRRTAIVIDADGVEDTRHADDLFTIAQGSRLREGDIVFCADSPVEWRLGAKNAIAPYWHVMRLNEDINEDIACEAYLPEWQLIKAADLIAIY